RPRRVRLAEAGLVSGRALELVRRAIRGAAGPDDARERGKLLPRRHPPGLGDATAASAAERAVVPDMLQRWRAGVVDRRAADPEHVRLTGGIFDRYRVLAADGSRRLLGVAIVRAVVAGGREHGLALCGRLLEQVVLGFLQALLA